MMRSALNISCLVAAAAACNPQWATPRVDAGPDASSDPDAEEESADTDADSADPSLEAGGGSDPDGSPPETMLDSNVRDAGAPNDADAPQDATPLNADGGCSDGYVVRNGACQDIDECFEGTHACHMTATCENSDGGYHCSCPLGYSGGTTAGFACAPRIAVGGANTGGAVEPHQCVLAMDDTVRCWGDNSVGQLGDGTTTPRVSPVGVLRNAALMSVGGRSACAVVLDGTLRCWGDNANGQLGDGTTTSRSAPVEIPMLVDVVSVSVGTAHSCAVLREGSIECWGSNTNGQLGNGSSDAMPVLAPVSVLGITTASDVFAFGGQTCAILWDGRAQCWGKGLLGDPSIVSSPSPVDVDIGGVFTRLAIGPFHLCGVQNDGDVACWGPPALNGNGITTGDAGPGWVRGVAASAVDIGIYSTCIIEPSGTMKCWDAGTKPAPVQGVASAIAFSAWGPRICHLSMDGSVSCWTIANGTATQPAIVPGVDLW